MTPIIVYIISIAWMLALGIVTTKCVDMSLVTIEGVFALLITVAVCIMLHEKDKSV